MPDKATTVKQYLDALPDDRRKALNAIRKVVKANLDHRIEEGIMHGMIGYFVPLSVYPAGYHCSPDTPLPFLSLASQKNHMAAYMFCTYCDPDEIARVAKEWKTTGKRLDMGKSCLRFKKLEDVPLEVFGAAVKRMSVDRFIEVYEKQIGRTRKAAPKKKKAAAKKKVSARRKTGA